MFDKKRRDEPISDAERAKVKEAEERNDVDQSAYNSIEKRLLNTPAHTPQGLATKVRIFRRYHANTSGVAAFVDEFVAIAERASPSDNPDAKLFALEVEMKAAHEGLDAAENTDDAHDPWYRRINATQDTAIAISAQTEAGVMAKLRMTAWFLNNPSETDEVYADWLRSAVADAERIGGAS